MTTEHTCQSYMYAVSGIADHMAWHDRNKGLSAEFACKYFAYSQGFSTSPRSRPGPMALTLCAPPSVIGPTVNWKGLPGMCMPRCFTLTW